MINYTNLDLQKMRLYNNGLIDKFESADMCVESLIGIQCQYQTYALISIYSRTKYKCNIFTSSNLIKSWGQRTTLHIYHKNDYNVISDLYCQSDNWVYKYAKHLKIDYHKYLKSITNFFNENNKSIIEKTEVQNIIPKYKSKEIMEWSGLLILATYHKVLYGILNELLVKLGMKKQPFFSSPTQVIPSVAIITIWIRVGFSATILLAGLQSIPTHYYEAALIDGASPVKSFFKITLPLLNSQIVLVCISEIIFAVKAFDQVFITTVGGPANSSRVIVLHLYETAFKWFDYNEASTIAILLFVLLMIISIFQWVFMRKKVEY